MLYQIFFFVSRNSLTGQNWKHTPDLYLGHSAITSRGPHNYGPARRVAEKPFIIVYGLYIIFTFEDSEMKIVQLY